MKKIAILLIVSSIAIIQLHAQQLPVDLKKYFGGSGTDFGQFITGTNDGNFLVIGQTESYDGDVSGNHGGGDIWVADINPSGTVLWQRALGGSSKDVAFSYAYNATDGSVVIAAYTESSNGDITVSRGNGDVWIAKLNSTGSLLWQKTLGGGGRETPLNIINTSDGNYLLSTETRSTNIDVTDNHGGSDIWLVKMDPAGTILWKRCYGGSANETGTNGDGFGSSLLEPVPGNYLFCANTASSNGDVIGFNGGYSDSWIVKTDATGNILWQNCIGGTGVDFSRKIKLTPNGTIVLLSQAASATLNGYHPSYGTASNFDVLLTSFSSAGTVQKQKCFGSSNNEYPYDLTVLNDSEYVFLAKITANGADVSGSNNANSFSRDIWMVKTTIDTIKWKKSFGGSKDEQQAVWIGNVVSSSDLYPVAGGDFVLTAITSSNDGNVVRSHPYGTIYDYDVWLLTLDSLGNIKTQNTIGEGKNEWNGAAGYFNSTDKSFSFVGSSESYNNNLLTTGSPAAIPDIMLYNIYTRNFIKGSVFLDYNNDHIQNSNEPLVNNANISITKTGTVLNLLSKSGRYESSLDSGKYTINCIPPSPYFAVYPANKKDTFNFFFRTDTINFALFPQPGKRDLGITVTPLRAVMPDSTAEYYISYFNQGTDTVATGTVLFKRDSRTSFISAVPAPDNISGDTLRWNYTAFKPFDANVIRVKLRANLSLTVADSLKHYAMVSPFATDLTPRDNTDTLYQRTFTTEPSIEKTENHGKYVLAAQVADSDYIKYVIRFRNTDSAPVNDIVIKDTLDASKLDMSTVQMITASHEYTLLINNGNQLQWIFKNVVLPPSSVDLPGSEGYIAFKVRVKHPLTPASQIKNTGYVQFDNSSPAPTNELITEVK
ncbi:MAG: hypothetical protein U0T68_03085 [Ferruginibacter sp.]